MESHGFPQLPTGTMPEELGPLTTANNDSPFQESPDLTATGYVRVSVVPGIQANSRGVGIIPTSSGSESLDQDSTVIIPGMEPPSPSRWRCDPHADTLPMTHTPQPQVSSQNVRMLEQDLTPPTPSPPRHHRRSTEALTTASTDCVQCEYVAYSVSSEYCTVRSFVHCLRSVGIYDIALLLTEFLSACCISDIDMGNKCSA